MVASCRVPLSSKGLFWLLCPISRLTSSHARPSAAKETFLWRIVQGKRSPEGQKNRSKDTLKSSRKPFYINPDTCEHAAVDRSARRSVIFKGAMTCEATRTAVAEQRRLARKARAMEPPTATTTTWEPPALAHYGRGGRNKDRPRRA
ncbi:hypothetical protein ACOMHN_020163 [Nucella lapillus]